MRVQLSLWSELPLTHSFTYNGSNSVHATLLPVVQMGGKSDTFGFGQMLAAEMLGVMSAGQRTHQWLCTDVWVSVAEDTFREAQDPRTPAFKVKALLSSCLSYNLNTRCTMVEVMEAAEEIRRLYEVRSNVETQASRRRRIVESSQVQVGPLGPGPMGLAMGVAEHGADVPFVMGEDSVIGRLGFQVGGGGRFAGEGGGLLMLAPGDEPWFGGAVAVGGHAVSVSTLDGNASPPADGANLHVMGAGYAHHIQEQEVQLEEARQGVDGRLGVWDAGFGGGLFGGLF
jgi:hypothetical protein